MKRTRVVGVWKCELSSRVFRKVDTGPQRRPELPEILTVEAEGEQGKLFNRISGER